MKNSVIILLTALMVGCSTGKKEKKEDDHEDVQSGMVADFLNDVKSLEKEDSQTPVIQFREIADRMAGKIMPVNKETINEVLTQAKTYTYCVITVEDHTIVKIDDVSNCKPSGSWGACMPYAEGYIKKGPLEYKKEYANYIIGQPDEQERTAYLFK